MANIYLRGLSVTPVVVLAFLVARLAMKQDTCGRAYVTSNLLVEMMVAAVLDVGMKVFTEGSRR